MKLTDDALVRWRAQVPYGFTPLGCVLAGDAALLLTTYKGSGQVTAFGRAGGGKLWRLDLSSPPVHDGLAVAADGRIVVCLRDGSVLCIAGQEGTAR